MFKESPNKISIIKALYFNGTITCAEISHVIGLSIPNVTKNLIEMIGEGIVIEKGTAPSKGGRKPALYALVAEQFYSISVAVDQFAVKMCLVNFNNVIVNTIRQVDFNLAMSTAEELAEVISAFINSLNIDPDKICGIGLTMPGFVDVENGFNKSFLNSSSTGLRNHLVEVLGLPVFLDNDSSAIALAELKFGAGREKKEIMVVNIGWGIGLGIIVKGEIFRGYSGFAGEFSHIPLFKNDKICSCGKRGCLETEASLVTLTERFKEAVEQGSITAVVADNDRQIGALQILQAANKGDDLAIGLVSDTGYHIGRALAILIHIMNPQAIVLSGKGVEAGKIWLAPIQQALNEFCIPTLLNDNEVLLSTLGSNAQLIGGAALVIENLHKIYLTNNSVLN